MKKGRKKKPTALKVLEGNRGHRPIPEDEPKPSPVCPKPPSWLRYQAKKEWKRIAPELYKLGLLTKLDIAALEAYCQTYAKWKDAEKKADLKKEKTGNNTKIINQWINVASMYYKQMTKMLAEFGLTPSSRTNIKVGKSDNEDPLSILD